MIQTQCRRFRKCVMASLAGMSMFLPLVPVAAENDSPTSPPVRTGRFLQEIEGFRTPVIAFVPEDYDPEKTYGLVVFLHGTRMTGAQMVQKTPVRKIHEAGYLLLVPTSNYGQWGVGEAVEGDARKLELARLRRMIEHFQNTYNLDEHCVHTVGFSIGTVLLAHGIGFFGEWDGLKIRSMMGFSGGLDGKIIPAKASRAKETAIWVMNGERDRGHTELYKNIYQVFKEAGYEARISEPRGLGHQFPLIPFESMIDWWRELDGDRITHDSPEVTFRQKKKQAVLVMREKRFDEARVMLEDVLALAPRDPQILYNLACLYSLTGDPDRALQYLDQAMEHGFRNMAHIQADADLNPLRELEAYQQLIQKYQP